MVSLFRSLRQGKEHVVEQNCSLQGDQKEGKGEKGRGGGRGRGKKEKKEEKEKEEEEVREEREKMAKTKEEKEKSQCPDVLLKGTPPPHDLTFFR